MIKKSITVGGLVSLSLLAYGQAAFSFTWGSVAGGNHTDSLHNPAHIMNADGVDKFSFHVNAYGYFNDSEDVIEQADALEKLIDDFDNLLDQGIATYSDGIQVLNDLQDASGNPIELSGEGEFLLTLPNLLNLPSGGSIPLAIFGKGTSRAAAEIYYDPLDANRVVNTITNQRIADSGATVSDETRQNLHDDIMALPLDPSKGLDPLMMALGIIADKHLPGSGIMESTDIPSGLDYDTLTLDLESEARADGYIISEFGVMSGYRLHDVGFLQSVDLGFALKYQDITTFQVREKIGDLDDYSFELKNHRTTASHVNIDLGAKANFGSKGQYQAGLTVKNLIPKDVKGKYGDVLELRPQVVLGFGYDWQWLAASLDVELLKNPEFGVLKASQYGTLGVEFKPTSFDFATFRLGYQYDIQNNNDDVFSAGFSLKALDEKFVIDVDGLYSGENSYGLKVGFGVNF